MQHFAENSLDQEIKQRWITKILGQKRGSRSSSVDPGHGRKDSKARADQASVRSHSSDIAEDIDRNITQTGLRLLNQNGSAPDNTMTVESGAASQGNDADSNKSRSKSLSSEGSSNKRKIKSNTALLNKHLQMKVQNGADLLETMIQLGSEQENTEDAMAEDDGMRKDNKKQIEAIDDEQASEIFNKLTKLQGKKTYYAKKNWTDDEAKLLQWAIQKYCRGKGITPQRLDKNDWMQIAGFIPGRNDSQCQYKFNQDKKSTIQKSNWVKREDEELVRLIRENGTKQWSQIANQLNQNLSVNRNGKQCRERWVNFLNPEIKKDPFSLAEDILILEKRLSIGNKWSEIIKEMPGRTENNVKNRFNMMFKNIKDEFIKNRTHQSVFVMQEKCDQDQTQVEDQIDEEKLIRRLIEKKTKELEEKKLLPSEKDTKNDVSGDISMNTGNRFPPNSTVTQELSDSQSNTNMNEASRRSLTNPTSFYNANSSNQDQSNSNAQTAQWANQKEFLKMSNTCQNKEQINNAIERLILTCPGQVNVIKRLVEYIQEDINRMIRISAAYASNTSMGSTNNVMGTPGNGVRLLDRNQSPNQNTLEHLSNHSISPSGEPRSTGLSGARQPYHQQKQVIVGADGQQTNVQVVKATNPQQPPQQNVYNSLIGTKNEAAPKTPVGAGQNKSPLGASSQLLRLPNGQIIRTAPGVTPQQNGRALTPNAVNRVGALNYQTSTNSQFTANRSMSPIGSEIPGEKQFIEVNTQEQLIISTIGIFASRKGEDRYVQLQSPEQILFSPFVQLLRKNVSTHGTHNEGPRYYDQKTPVSNARMINETPGSGHQQKFGVQHQLPIDHRSQNTPSPLDHGFGKNKISPGQFLYSIQNRDGTVFQQPIVQQANGQLVIIQNVNNPQQQRVHQRSASANVQGLRYQNPQVLANYQPQGVNQYAQNNFSAMHSAMQSGNPIPVAAINANGQQLNQYFTNTSSNQNQNAIQVQGNGVGQQQMVARNGATSAFGGNQMLPEQQTQGPMNGVYNTTNSSGLAVDSKIGSTQSNIPMHISGLSGQVSGGNLSGNNPLSFKGVQAASQLPKQPQFNLPAKTTTAGGSSNGQMSQIGNQAQDKMQ